MASPFFLISQPKHITQKNHLNDTVLFSTQASSLWGAPTLDIFSEKVKS